MNLDLFQIWWKIRDEFFSRDIIYLENCTLPVFREWIKWKREARTRGDSQHRHLLESYVNIPGENNGNWEWSAGKDMERFETDFKYHAKRTLWLNERNEYIRLLATADRWRFNLSLYMYLNSKYFMVMDLIISFFRSIQSLTLFCWIYNNICA